MIFCCQSVSADTVAEMTQKVMNRLDISVTADDTGILRFYKNHALVDGKYKPLLASAVRAGVLVPVDGILAPESEDLTSVRNGLIAFGLKNPYMKLVAGKLDRYKIGGAEVTKETVRVDALTEGEVYTALVDRDNLAFAVWKPDRPVLPTLYRGRLYVKSGNIMIMYETQRSAYNMWLADKADGLAEVDITGTTIAAADDLAFNEKFMDEVVYYVADGYSN